VPASWRDYLSPVVVVEHDLPVLVKGIGLGHLERRPFPGRRRGLVRLGCNRLSLFKGVSLGDLGVGRHNKAKSTPRGRLSSGPRTTAEVGLARRTSRPRGTVASEQPSRHNHPPHCWAP
jgi:hypothetical protein